MNWIKSNLKTFFDTRLFLALLCAVELFIIQEFTFIVDRPMEAHQLLMGKIIRFGLDYLIFIVILWSFNKILIYSMFVVQALVYLGLTNYFLYFRRPLSIITLIGQFDEAIIGLQTGLVLVSSVTVIVLTAVLICKIALLRYTPFTAAKFKSRSKAVAVVAIVYSSIIILLVLKLDPLKQFETHATVSRMGNVYGYFWTWVGEYWYLKDERLLKRAIASADSYKAKPVDIPELSIERDLVMIQVESLDFEVIHKKVGGKELTPFLNQLAISSIFYKARAIHFNGSADADFSMLTSQHPSTDIVTYKILDYPYENTLPQKLNELGYFTAAYHGIHGDFFNTKNAFANMGFDDLNFLEDMRIQPGIELAWWGIKDGDLVKIASRNWRDQRNFQFLITMTSHTPFNQLKPSENLFIERPANTTERYYNSINYADRCIAGYIADLPEDTAVIIYGDHESGVFRPAGISNPGVEFVPFIFSKKGYNLATTIDYSSTEALSGDYSLIDLSRLVHGIIGK